MFDLSKRVALVTGASSGMGVNFAKALARQGADIVLMARRLENMKELSKEIEGMGRKCLPVRCDVTDTADIDAALAEVKKHFKRVDILINNAGVFEGGPSEKHTDEQWNKVINTDLTGAFKMARAVADQFMIPQKYGRIISTASMYGVVGNNVGSIGQKGLQYGSFIGYFAAKAGVINMTRALGAEWAHYNITVNAIAPGYIVTGFSTNLAPEFMDAINSYCPMQRLGKAEELESAIIYYAADESSYTTGTTLLIDGGWTAI